MNESCATGAANRPALLCCDWGTSSFRLRWVDEQTRQMLAEVRSDEGIASTFSAWQAGAEQRLAVYQRVLAKHIALLEEQTGCSLKDVPIVISGMASSSIGMAELPYAELPFSVDGSGAMVRRMESSGQFPHEELLMSGVRSEHDVMRGEETQLIGLYATCGHEAAFQKDALLILPGTHSKHILVEGGIMTDFRTYMTGEQFGLLVQHSILKDSVTQPESSEGDETDWQWFGQGVRAGASANLLHALFSVRTNQLFGRANKRQNYLYLSGLVIGGELNELANKPQSLILCSGSHVYPLYQRAMQELGLPFSVVPPEVIEKSAVMGQMAVYKRSNQGIIAQRFQ